MRIRKNVDFIISGGLWWTDEKKISHSLNLLFDEYKQIKAGTYSRFGLMTYRDKSFKFGWYAWTKDLKDMLGGSPALVINGKRNIDGGGVFGGRQPRAGVGENDDYFFMVTVDGRQKGKQGATQTEFANIAIKLGCKNFMSGDGGGTVNLEGRNGTLNSPTENRPMNNAIGVKLKEEYKC